MPPVRMYIEKFGGEVLIDSDHPLAVAQRARDTATASASAPPDPPASPDSSAEGGEHTATHSDDAPAAAATVAPVQSAESDSPSIEAVAARLTEKPDSELQALAKEAGLDVEASHDSLVADLASLIHCGLMELE